MRSSNPFYCRKENWFGRKAHVVSNGIVRLTTLLGGGHLADFRLIKYGRSRNCNPLWTAPWPTIEPQTYSEKKHAKLYGSTMEGKLLSGLSGHNICLDYFGSPSQEEANRGLSQHGEAAWSKWRTRKAKFTKESVSLELGVKLPVAGLELDRKIEMRGCESVARFTETVSNKKKSDHCFHWAEHVTLGFPFLSTRESSIVIPGTKGITFPHGYDEGRALLASNKTFRWPNAPLVDGDTIDLTRPFLRRGLGFVVAVLLNKDLEVGYITAINHKKNLMVAYCFKRSDFPWVAVWEENRGILAPPWKQRTRARGLEFSTTPLPVTRRESFQNGPLFGESTNTFVAAGGKKEVRYLAFLAQVPKGFGRVTDISVKDQLIAVSGSGRKDAVTVACSNVRKFLHDSD